MKKFLLSALVLLISIPGFSMSSALFSAMSSFASDANQPFGKELLIAAQDDAAFYIETDGQVAISPVLKAALQVLNANAQMAQLTDLEKAQAIVYLAAQP